MRGGFVQRGAALVSWAVLSCSGSTARESWQPPDDASPPPSLPELGAPEELFIGGQPSAVSVAGDYAYVADIHGLWVVRITQTGIEQVARRATAGAATDLALVDGRVYVADGKSGLAVFDVSNPADPRLLHHTRVRGGARRIHASAEMGIAVLDGDGWLTVLRPGSGGGADEIIGELLLPGVPASAAWIGSRLYVADDGHAFLALEVDAAGLRVVWEDRSRIRIRSLAASGRWLFAACGSKHLLVFDAENAIPEQVASLALNEVPTSLSLVGDRLIVASFMQSSTVVDIADPRVPRLEAVLDLPVHAAAPTARAGVAVTADDTPGVALIELGATPRTLAELAGARVSQLESDGASLLAIAAHMDSHIAAMPSSWFGVDRRHGLRLFNLPKGRGAPEMRATSGADHYWDAGFCGDAICALSGERSLCLLRESGAGKLAPVGECSPIHGAPSSVAWQERRGRAWVTNQTGYLFAFTKEAELVAAGSSELDRPYSLLMCMTVDGDTGIAVNGRAALFYVFDLTGDSAEQIGELYLQDRPTDLAMAGSTVFVAEPRFGVQVISIENPRRPEQRAWVAMESPPMAVAATAAADGSVRVALALKEDGVALYSWRGGVLAPLAAADTPGLATDVLFAGGALWVADSSALLRFDLGEESP